MFNFIFHINYVMYRLIISISLGELGVHQSVSPCLSLEASYFFKRDFFSFFSHSFIS